MAANFSLEPTAASPSVIGSRSADSGPQRCIGGCGSAPLGICHVIMQKLPINKRSLLRVFLGIYLFLLSLVCFSLSVPPADLPLCGLMSVLAAFGLFLARRENRAWRVVWTSALIASIIFGALQIIAGRSIAHQRSKHDSSMRLTMPDKPPEDPTAVGTFRSAVAVHATSRRWLSFIFQPPKPSSYGAGVSG